MRDNPYEVGDRVIHTKRHVKGTVVGHYHELSGKRLCIVSWEPHGYPTLPERGWLESIELDTTTPKLTTGRFAVKDSGAREEYAGGMRRDTQEGKARFDLMFPLDVPYSEQMLTRFAEHLERGTKKYGVRNWETGGYDPEILDRAKSSALRHMVQWLTGIDDGEDHASAVYFNIMVVERQKYLHGKEEEAKGN